MTVIVSYNGVTLPYPMITDFKQESVYEESKTDRVLTRFDVTVQCYLAPEFIQMLNNGVDDPSIDNPSKVVTKIRDRLMTQRKSLSIMSNGNELIPAVSVNRGTVDSKNGPTPEFCHLVELTEGSFLLQYRIVAHYWENPSVVLGAGGSTTVNGVGAAVLSNRWTESVDIDNCLYSKRNRTGKFIIRSDNSEGLTVDSFRRQMCDLGIPPGFVRESAKYTVTEDGLALEYTIVDKEVYVQPLSPAYEASGHYIETTVRNGAQRIGLIHIKLKGSRKSPRALMIETAVLYAVTHLQLQSPLGGIKFVSVGNGKKEPRFFFKFLEHAIVKVSLFTNEVEVTMQSRMNTGNDHSKGRVAGVWGLHFTNLAKVLSNRKDDQPPPYKLRGEVPLLLQAAAYYDPDLGAQLSKIIPQSPLDNVDAPTGPNIIGQMNRGLLPGQAGRNPEN